MAEKQMEMDLTEKVEVIDEKPEKTELATVVNTGTAIGNPFESKESFNNLFTMAQAFSKSELVPQAYQGKVANIMLAIDIANRIGMNPLFVMQQTSVVRGKISWSGQACSMIVNAYPKFKNVKLNYVGKQGSDDWGAYVTAIRKDTGEEVKGATVDMKMVKAEGWDSNVKWKSMPEQMLGYRAYTFFARLHCADALNGFMTEGEYEDAYGEPKEAPSFD